MTHPRVTSQVDPESVSLAPFWKGEVAAVAQVPTQTGLLQAIQDQV